MMENPWYEGRAFTRFLEIVPGAIAWSLIISPWLLAPFFPQTVTVFILLFNLYWVAKALNMIRHLLGGYYRMRRNMKINWLAHSKKASNNASGLLESLKEEYQKRARRYLKEDIVELENNMEVKDEIKPWKDIYHLVIITNYKESFEITKPTYDAIKNSNYPNDKIIILGTGEHSRDAEGWKEVKKQLTKEFGNTFFDIFFNDHTDKVGEVLGKGPNLYSAGIKAVRYLKKKHPQLNPENIMVTTLDADHIVHSEYFGRLTYKYIIDPNRHSKTYQPVGLLFNNIWDAPAPNRIAAISSSFWQMVEAMRPYRLRTFASHAQPLSVLMKTDFWSTQTIVEDGHQYWRTYFAYSGEHYMVPTLIPVYQDCVLAESWWKTFTNQYNQRKRWAYGVSDFPYVIKKCIRHTEIPLYERFLQVFRIFAGHISWSTASIFIATAWIPISLNTDFRDEVVIHNVLQYGSVIMRVAWVGLIANAFVYLSLLPERPSRYGRHRYLNMIVQWIFIAPVSIFLSSAPALEAQTRLMLGKYMNVFFLTPKYRKQDPNFGQRK